MSAASLEPVQPQALTTAPAVTYRFVVTATIEDHTPPLNIEGNSLNDIHRAIRLLDANGLIVEQQLPAASTPTNEQPPTCNLHNRPMTSSKKPGTWFYSAKLADGTYCMEKVD